VTSPPVDAVAASAPAHFSTPSASLRTFDVSLPSDFAISAHGRDMTRFLNADELSESWRSTVLLYTSLLCSEE
jgi:hypothetical protein